jgi:hypothetical protein
MKQKGVLKKRLALSAGILLIGLVGGVAAQAALFRPQAPVLRSAPISKFDGVNEIVFKCTRATSYVTLPQMTRTFNVGGPGNGSVVVRFDGSLSLDASGGSFDTGFVRLRIDGAQQSPGDIPVIAPDERGTHGFTWQSKPLSPGSHTATVQWRTDLGSQFCVDARSLTVLHK